MVFMRKKYTVTLIAIAILIVLLLGVEVHYQTYTSEKSDLSAFIKVEEGLSINNLNGTEIDVHKKSQQVEFSVTNQLTETLYYNIDILRVDPEVSATYRLVSSDSNFQEIIQPLTQNAIASRIAILPGDTHRYQMEIINDDRNEFVFELAITKENVDNSFANTILNNNDIKENVTTLFNTTATENEGLIKKSTEHGSEYYFRGNISNNYVSFANLLWRIVKINEDNTVKLVLDNTTESLVAMNNQEQVGNTDFLMSNAYQNLTNWYNTYLLSYDDYIASTYYCFDNSVSTDEMGQINYLSDIRLFTDYLPNTVCSGLNVSAKIALLTADEVMMAGATNTGNNSYYLYLNGLQASWWTMTPNKKENNVLSYITVSKDGALTKDVSETSGLFLRPSITITRKTIATGSGTIDDSYVLSLM